jgi:putative hemolysin
MVYSLGHIPEPGEAVTWNGYRFEVVDMDGKRVDKVLLVPPPESPEGKPREE